MKTFCAFVGAVLMASTCFGDNCQGQIRVQLQAAPVVVQHVPLMVQAPVVVQQQQAHVVLQQQVPYVVQQAPVVVQQAPVVVRQQHVAVQQVPVLVQQHSVRQVAPLLQGGLLRSLLNPPARQRVVVRSVTSH